MIVSEAQAVRGHIAIDADWRAADSKKDVTMGRSGSEMSTRTTPTVAHTIYKKFAEVNDAAIAAG